MSRILCLSYDESLSNTRQMLLRAYGYDVVSALGKGESLNACKDGTFDLLILGHCIPLSDRVELAKNFREHCSAPIIALRRYAGAETVAGADYHLEPDPEPLLKLIAEILATQSKPAESTTRPDPRHLRMSGRARDKTNGRSG